MIILDTNIISELMKPHPSLKVFEWAAMQSRAIIFTTTINEAEIHFGIAVLPEGRRKLDLFAGATKMFTEKLADRILPFDREAAYAYALIASACRQRGQPISQSDAQIAGIVSSRGASLATRNTRDFQNCGFELIDPWSAEA